MKPRLMEYVWIGLALGLAVVYWKKSHGASSPPADQLYHPTLNPYGYVYSGGQWVRNDPGTTGQYFYI